MDRFGRVSAVWVYLFVKKEGVGNGLGGGLVGWCWFLSVESNGWMYGWLCVCMVMVCLEALIVH